ncbi:MAG: hypothetical protein ACI8WB_003532 [Phenylobacterium sp.]|jgi:hypothetical protein
MLLQQISTSGLMQRNKNNTYTHTSKQRSRISQAVRASMLLGAVGSLTLSSSLFAAPDPVDDIKAMFVGHSLINNVMPEMLRQLAQSGEGLSMIHNTQIFNGSTLKHNWAHCQEGAFIEEYPPNVYACDELAAAASSQAYDTLVVTDANALIPGHHFWDDTQVYLENFTELLKTHNSQGRAYLFTSWESRDLHTGEWTDYIAKELMEYEQIVLEAENLSAAKGINADIELIPANVALRELIIKIENGEMNGLSQRDEIFHDDVHMNSLGNYFMANVVFAATYNRSPEGLTNDMVQLGNNSILVEPTLALQLQQLAWDVVTDYRATKALPDGDNVAPNGVILTPNGDWQLQLGHRMAFVGTASDANGDTNLTYQWDLGTLGGPQFGTTTTEFVFNTPGTYDVSLMVTDPRGLSDPSPATVHLTVLEPAGPNLPPNAEITSPVPFQGAKMIDAGESLGFNAIGSDPDADPLTYLWHFDGAAPAQSGASTTEVTFDTVGDYTVSVTVTDSKGLADPTPATILVAVVAPIPAEQIGSFVALEPGLDGLSLLTWNAPAVVANIDHYNVNLNSQTVETLLSTTTRFELTGLNPYRINEVSISGIDADGKVIAESGVIPLPALTSNGVNTPNEKSAIGINLTGLNYWSTQWMLIDVMRQASNGSGELWATSNGDTYAFNTGHQSRLNLDAQGWPQSLPERDDPDFHYATTIIYQDNSSYPVGEYVVLYDGEGELSYNGGTYMPTKSSPGRHVVQLEANSFLHLRIRQTDPNNTGNHIRNVRILVPGGICDIDPSYYAQYPADCNGRGEFNGFEQVYQHLDFHPLFLADMAKYRSIRFMQMFSTNVSNQSVWTDRPTYDYASWGLNNGSPVEMAIDLANKVQAEPWLNIPARVDDDYMRQYAQLVKNNLDANLSVHIELGNEVWNNAYPYNLDATWLREQGKLLWPDAGVDDFMYRLNFYGKRTSDMCEIFKQEFGNSADRVKCVMGAQGGNAWVGEQSLQCTLWAAQNGGQNCAHNMDSLAIGPYFAGYLADDKYLPYTAAWSNEGEVGMAKLFDEINSGILRDLTYNPDEPEWQQAPVGGSLAQAQRFMAENKAVAERHGMKLSAYEGGQHLTFAGNLTGDRALVNENIFLAGNRDARMGQAFTNYFTDWKEAGGSLFMVFESTGGWGSYGAFALKEYQTQPMSETPKLAETLAFIDANDCWWADCDRVTNAFDRVTVDPLPEPPALGHMALTATPKFDTRGVTLNWQAHDGLVHTYHVFRDDGYVGETAPGVTTLTNHWLQLHQQYSFQIKALDYNGMVLAQSDIVTSLAGDSVAPSQPSNVSVVFNGGDGFNVSWTPSVDNESVAWYEIYRNGASFTTRTEPFFADEWPPQDTMSYQIFAHDHTGNISEGSAVVFATVPSQSLVMSADVRPENWGVALSWNFSHADVQYFQVFRDGVFVGHTNADGTSFNNDWLSLHTDYSFQVRAVDAAGALLMASNTVTLQAGDSVAPSQPTGLTMTYNGEYGFNVTWDAATDNTGVAYYKIYRNGESYTIREGLLLTDEWPGQDETSYQIIAVDHYHNESAPSVVVSGSIPQQ